MSTSRFQSVSNAVVSNRHDVIAIASGDEAMLTLDENGMICDCNHACETLFRYRRSELAWRPVSMLMPQLAKHELMKSGQPNPYLRFLCRIGHRFEALTQDGEHFQGALFLNVIDGRGLGRLSLIVRQIGIKHDEQISHVGNVFNKYATSALLTCSFSVGLRAEK